MPGIKKTFLFMPIRAGIVLRRDFACWCNACMRASAPGEGSMDSSYRCVECVSDLPWDETSIQRSDAAGVANDKARKLAHARDLARQLACRFEASSQPVWVAIENRGEDDPDSYWVGKARRITHTYTATSTQGRTRYDKGDMEIEVEWFTREISGGEERRIFKRWARSADGKDAGPQPDRTYTFNSTELRAIGAKMQPVPPVGGVPLEVVRQEARPAPRKAAVRSLEGIRNVLFVAHKQRAEPPEQLWEIPEGEERAILDHC
uniref:Uncharacterized protein n=1 Tax=Coccolithus braarudii TaxID=221442 RepID=A0A7S0LUV0_9EUKA|mmetsp:Transcript_7191/g.15756  ORF Transcript_7191/g.15756 Transcript_7191/m.15756 type:complete len:262 (+) Transcript_7191:676-1461(+)